MPWRTKRCLAGAERARVRTVLASASNAKSPTEAARNTTDAARRPTARTGPTEGTTPGRISTYACGLDIICWQRRTGREPRRVPAITFDSPRHPLPVAWNPPVADIARPRINDVGGSVHIPGVAGTRDDGVFALEILRGRILVPSPGPRAGEANCKRCPTDDASDFHSHIPQFLAEIGRAEITGKAGPLRIMCPYGPWISPPLVM
jgi:hypothetical protein